MPVRFEQLPAHVQERLTSAMGSVRPAVGPQQPPAGFLRTPSPDAVAAAGAPPRPPQPSSGMRATGGGSTASASAVGALGLAAHRQIGSGGAGARSHMLSPHQFGELPSGDAEPGSDVEEAVQVASRHMRALERMTQPGGWRHVVPYAFGSHFVGTAADPGPGSVGRALSHLV
ncbi:MAG TPA: hypothetical protein VFN61_16020 [Acidimicrobiales bacterium]|nr:hypothetical protein [Acidimicrobiales bacterium]